MNKKVLILAGLTLLLPACGETPENTKVDRVINKTVYYYDDDEDKLKNDFTLPVFYKANSDIPYLSLDSGAELINFIRKSRSKSVPTITVSKSGTKDVYSVNGAKCEFDTTAQTISFEKFDEFFQTDTQYSPLTLLGNSKSIKISREQEYVGNKSYSIDLKPYTSIDLCKYGEDTYIPTQVYSDLFLSAFESINLTHNFKDFFLVSETTPLEQDLFGIKILTKLGNKFWSGPKKTTISEGYSKFYYDSLCFNFDHTYGYKGRRSITSFDQYVQSKNFKNDLLSLNVHTADNTLAYALSSLLDHHTVKTGASPLYKHGDDNVDISKFDPKDVAYQKGSDKFQKDKKTAGINHGYQTKAPGGTAFINFNEFTDINEDSLYKSTWEKDELVNTQILFADAYKKIVADSTIKNVVVDLSTNDGGAFSSLVYSLGVLIGEAHYDVVDPFTGASLRTYYKVDINLDGKIDANDKSLAELGKNIVFLTSEYSFSSANAMPVFAKDNNADVLILGENTGGGPCPVRKSINAIGTQFVQSGNTYLAKKVGGNLIDIDDGVGPTDPNKTLVTKDNLFDYDYIDVIIQTALLNK